MMLKQIQNPKNPLRTHLPDAPEKRNYSNHGDADEKAKKLYWSSNKAKKLFDGNYVGTSDVRGILKERISILQQVNQSVDGYQLVIPMT